MEKHVIINVTSVQRDETGKDEKITLETPGIYGEEGNMRYVSYRETKLAGMEGTTTTLRVYEDHVSLLREAHSCRSRSTASASHRSRPIRH